MVHPVSRINDLSHRRVHPVSRINDLGHRMHHPVTEIIQIQSMICIAEALALPDDLGHRMVHPVTRIIDDLDYRMPSASGDRI